MSAPITTAIADTQTIKQPAVDLAQDQLFDAGWLSLPDPVEILASALLADADDQADAEPIDQPYLPGLVRTCSSWEVEGSSSASGSV